jgi:hypothetical protein
MSIYGFSLRFILHAKRQEQFPFDGSLSFPYFYDNLMQYYTIQNFYLIDKKFFEDLVEVHDIVEELIRDFFRKDYYILMHAIFYYPMMFSFDWPVLPTALESKQLSNTNIILLNYPQSIYK